MNRTLAILGIIACAVVAVLFVVGGSLSVRLISQPQQAAAKPAYVEHCVGKVVYIQFENAVVTKLKTDGKPWTCGGV